MPLERGKEHVCTLPCILFVTPYIYCSLCRGGEGPVGRRRLRPAPGLCGATHAPPQQPPRGWVLPPGGHAWLAGGGGGAVPRQHSSCPGMGCCAGWVGTARGGGYCTSVGWYCTSVGSVGHWGLLPTRCHTHRPGRNIYLQFACSTLWASGSPRPLPLHPLPPLLLLLLLLLLQTSAPPPPPRWPRGWSCTPR